MSTNTTEPLEDLHDQLSSSESSETSSAADFDIDDIDDVSVVDAEEEATEETAAKPTCEKCGTTEDWGMASWCPVCGFYPAFGVCTEDRVEKTPEVRQMETMWDVIPPWSYWLMGGSVALVGFSIFIRLTGPSWGTAATLTTLLLSVIGSATLATAHFKSYLFATFKSDKTSPLDLFFKPIEVWKPTFQILPESKKRVTAAGWGITAVLCGFFIVGTWQLNDLFADWGFRKRAKPNLIAAVAEQAKKASKDQTMEEALEELADQGEPAEEEEKKPVQIETACLVIGYQTKANGELSMILLASLVDKKLQYVASLTAKDLPESARKELLERMPKLHRSYPVVKTTSDAQWIQPKIMCNVLHNDWTPAKLMKNPRFSTMLRDVDAGQ